MKEEWKPIEGYEGLYEVVADPCFSFEKNTVWIFAQKIVSKSSI